MAKENAIYPVRDRQREERKIFFNKYEQIILQGAGIESDLQFADLVWKEIQKIPYALKLFDDVIPVLEQLRLLGYKLIILSNVDRNSDELMDFLGLRNLTVIDKALKLINDKYKLSLSTLDVFVNRSQSDLQISDKFFIEYFSKKVNIFISYVKWCKN